MEEDPSATSYTLSPETEKLIRSNDPPLESQANEISEILKVAKNCKATLELEIEEVQSRLLRLQRADENITRHIARFSLALRAVRRLPPEILSCIFLSYFRIGRKDSKSENQRNIWRLGHICRYWRTVALSTQELWSEFTVACSMRDKTEMVRIWLQRVGAHPLSFKFECDDYFAWNGRHKSCADALAPFISCSAQWRNARFRLHHDLVSTLAPVLGHIPLLETLKFDAQSGYIITPEVPFDAFSVAPKLRALSISGMCREAPTAALPWSQITCYAGDVYWHHTHVLTLALNILDFTLDTQGTDDSEVGDLVVHQLRHFHFRSGSLSRLILPALETLRFPMSREKRNSNMMLPTDLRSISDLLTRSHTNNLTVLRIDDCDRPSRELLALFKTTPALASLTLTAMPGGIHDYVRTHQFFFGIAHHPEDPTPTLLPRLQHISVYGLTPIVQFALAVESRRTATPETVRLESLTVELVHDDFENSRMMRSGAEKAEKAYVERLIVLRADGMEVSFKKLTDLL